MDTKVFCKRLCLMLLLLVAFYLGGTTAMGSEIYHESLVMSCGIFTAVFTSIIALGAKVYHFLFF